MSDAFTAKSFQIERAPKRISLVGDKVTKPEPAQHIIEFPGGAIEVSRVEDGVYWVHVIVTRKLSVSGDTPMGKNGPNGPIGRIIDSRIHVPRSGDLPGTIDAVPWEKHLDQIAILVSTKPE